MGYKLRREVRDALPPGLLSQAERNVILEIADDANDETRRTMKGPDDLASRVDVTPSALRKHVQRIEAKNIPLRIEIAKGRDGRPVYACAGTQTNYRIPPIEMIRAAGKGGRGVQPSRKEGGHPVHERADGSSTPEGWTSSAERVDGLSIPSPQYSSRKNSPPPQGATSAEAPSPAPTAGPERMEEAIELIKKNTTDIYGHDLGKLAIVVASAITAGWSQRILGETLARDTGGLDNPLYGLIRRVEKLGDPPQPTTEPAKTPCPLHRGQPNAYTCGTCRSRILAGEDPYDDQEHLRPADWWQRFPSAERLKPAATAQATPAPDDGAPRPPRRCDHGRIAVNCPTCRNTTPGTERHTEPIRRGRPEPSPCGNPMCRGGQLHIGANIRPCQDCAAAKPAEHKEPFVLGELANVRPEQPSHRGDAIACNELAAMLTTDLSGEPTREWAIRFDYPASGGARYSEARPDRDRMLAEVVKCRAESAEDGDNITYTLVHRDVHDLPDGGQYVTGWVEDQD